MVELPSSPLAEVDPVFEQMALETADVLAVIRFIAPYSGYPAAADALGVLPGIVESLGLDTDVPADAALDSVDAGRPDQPDALPVCSDAWMSDLLAFRIGRSWSEERLSVRERAFVALTADVCFQTLGSTFRRHVRIAQNDGVPDDDIRDAVRFTAELGVVRAANALEELEKILG